MIKIDCADRFSRDFARLLVCAGLLVGGMGRAYAEPPHHLYGLGILSCEQAIAAARVEETRKLILAWPGGYLSGYNRGTIDNRKLFFALNGLTSENLIQGLVTFCKKHPESNLDFWIQTLRFSMKVEDWKGD